MTTLAERGEQIKAEVKSRQSFEKMALRRTVAQAEARAALRMALYCSNCSEKIRLLLLSAFLSHEKASSRAPIRKNWLSADDIAKLQKFGRSIR